MILRLSLALALGQRMGECLGLGAGECGMLLEVPTKTECDNVCLTYCSVEPPFNWV